MDNTTPIQEAIQNESKIIAGLKGDVSKAISMGAMFDKIHVQILLKHHQECKQHLESLLPKEKEFVGKVWDAARDETVYPDTSKGTAGVGGQLVTSGYTHDKENFLNQLYPKP